MKSSFFLVILIFCGLIAVGQTFTPNPPEFGHTLSSSILILKKDLAVYESGNNRPIPDNDAQNYTYTLTSVPGVWVGEGEDATYVPKGALYLLHNGSWGTALAKDATWTQEDINQG